MQLIHDGLILTYDVIEFLDFVSTYVDCLNVCQACLSASISREPRVSYIQKFCMHVTCGRGCCGFVLRARRPGDIDRLRHGRRSAAAAAAAQHGAQQQTH